MYWILPLYNSLHNGCDRRSWKKKEKKRELVVSGIEKSRVRFWFSKFRVWFVTWYFWRIIFTISWIWRSHLPKILCGCRYFSLRGFVWFMYVIGNCKTLFAEWQYERLLESNMDWSDILFNYCPGTYMSKFQCNNFLWLSFFSCTLFRQLYIVYAVNYFQWSFDYYLFSLYCFSLRVKFNAYVINFILLNFINCLSWI